MNTRSSHSPDTAAIPAADTPSIPVAQLFDQRDTLFLRSAPGYSSQMEAGFRRRRCGVFRAYLRGLRAEFRAARIELGALPVRSPRDYRQLAPQFARCRMRFAWAMIPANLCLWRYRWELGRSPLEPVVQRLEGVCGEMRRFVSELSEPRY